MEAVNALSCQVGGSHYADMKMQPIELIVSAELNFIQGCIVKYISRYKAKNGKQDIEKCIHYANLANELNCDGNTGLSIGEGYAFCKMNNLSELQRNVIISAMRDDYANVIRYCNAIIRQEYSNQ